MNYVGEEVAAVAAIDLATAEDALELIEVEYEPLPPVHLVRDALKPMHHGFTLVHPAISGRPTLRISVTRMRHLRPAI